MCAHQARIRTKIFDASENSEESFEAVLPESSFSILLITVSLTMHPFTYDF